MNMLTAQLVATLHAFGQRMQDRAERGQTTAEYAGILAFVGLLVVAVIGFGTDLGDTVGEWIGTALETITGNFGG